MKKNNTKFPSPCGEMNLLTLPLGTRSVQGLLKRFAGQKSFAYFWY